MTPYATLFVATLLAACTADVPTQPAQTPREELVVLVASKEQSSALAVAIADAQGRLLPALGGDAVALAEPLESMQASLASGDAFAFSQALSLGMMRLALFAEARPELAADIQVLALTLSASSGALPVSLRPVLPFTLSSRAQP